MKKLFYIDETKPFNLKVSQKMKLTVFLTIVSLFQIQANTYSQNKKISLHMPDATVEEVIQEIESLSDFKFLLNRKDVDMDREVSITIEKEKIATVLSELFGGTDVEYEVLKKQIILRKMIGQVDSSKNSIVAGSSQINVQFQVSGTVTDANGAPLPGASILEEGTTNGVQTDFDGNYSIGIADENATLVFSYIGFAAQEVSVNGQSNVNIQLEESAQGLDEVVVVGYGTQKRVNLTGSVADIGGEELTTTPAISLTNSITGLLPGVVTKNVSGEPGQDNASILIRGRNTTGNNSPLIVVDGIQDAPGWQYINPNAIESVSVLKDASAAIYGARAANGVILITTKRGISGKPVVNLTFNQGISEPTQIPEMGNSASLAGYFNELLTDSGQPPRYTDAEIEKFRDGSDPLNYPNVDWFEEVLKKNSYQSNLNITMRGGSNEVKYLISGSSSDQNSIFKNGSHNFKTHTLRSNLDAQVTKNIKLSLDVNGGIEDRNAPAFPTNVIFQGLNYNLPFTPVYYPNGLPSAGVERGENPIIMASDATGNNNNTVQNFSAKVSFDINIPWTKGLGIDGYFNYFNETVFDKNWRTPWTAYNYDRPTDTYIPITGGGILNPQLTQEVENGQNTLTNLRIKYENGFGDHNVDTFIAYEQSQGNTMNFSAFRRDFLSSQIDQLFAGSLNNQEADGTAFEVGRKNIFGRIHYDFKGKYLVDFNYRYDGSSNFREGERYGFFPGLSAAWKIAEEKFIRNNFSFIDNLKLRASIGQIGNDQIAAFQFLQLYNLTEDGYSFGQTPSLSLGLNAGVIPNPNVTWEVATVSNLGLDGTFWNSLLGFSFDVFKQRRSNILATRNLSIPDYTGLSLPNENIGVVENKGFEIELTHANTINDFSYQIAGNFAYASNKVIDIDEAPNVPEWQKAEGRAIGASRYYISTGIIRTQEELDNIPIYPGTIVGDLKYQDTDGDGVISAADQVRLDKTNTPQITYGFNFSLNYKAFSLFANFAGAAKVWQPYRFRAVLGFNALQDLLDNRYTEGSMDSKYPNLPQTTGVNSVNSLPSTFWLYDTSFLRLKTLDFGYALPQPILSEIGVRSLRIYISGSNLLTFSKLKLLDPETDAQNGFYYPQNRIYNLGINLTF